jgi:2-aminoadipate transaminase
MEWDDLFASRTRLMRRSTVREILKHGSKPGMISFAGGLPAPELFPTEEINAAASRALAHYGSRALQYGESEGIPELRDYVAGRFTHCGLKVSRENVLITSGGQQALDLLGRTLLEKGDHVLVENPTYLALLSAWRPYGTEFRGVRSDEWGLDPADLEGKLRAKPKALYLVPNFQNPQGTTLPLSRRETLLKLIKPTETILVEDDPYGELRYEGTPLPSLLELAGSTRSNVVHVGTFSKIIAPGFRIGWAVGPAELIDKLVLVRQAVDLHSSTFGQLTVWELIRSGLLEAHLPKLREHYRARRDIMLEQMAEQFPGGVSWTRPEGGMFLMVTLPKGIAAKELARAALEKNVLFVPGDDFHLSGGENTFRLNFSNASPENIREGIRRLAALLEEALQKSPPEPVPAGLA